MILLLVTALPGWTQKCTIGGALRYPVQASLTTIPEQVFYFADDVNSIYIVRPEDKMKPRSLLFPEVFARYMFNDNIFIRYNFGYLSYLKSVNINYNSRFHDNLNYTNSFDYSYLTNQLGAGYRFLRGKEVRMHLSAGVSHYYLIRFKEVSRKDESLLLVNQFPYGQLIHQDFSSITRSLFTYHFEVGLEYYLFTLSVSYQNSFTGLNEQGDFYDSYQAVFINAGINIFNFLVENKKFIRHKAER